MSQTPPPPPPPGSDPAEPAPPDFDGVLIRIDRDGDGEEEVSIQTFGSVKRRELPGLLGIARRMAEDSLGIGRG